MSSPALGHPAVNATLPAEIWDEVCFFVDHARDLLHLALTCSRLKSFVMNKVHDHLHFCSVVSFTEDIPSWTAMSSRSWRSSRVDKLCLLDCDGNEQRDHRNECAVMYERSAGCSLFTRQASPQNLHIEGHGKWTAPWTKHFIIALSSMSNLKELALCIQLCNLAKLPVGFFEFFVNLKDLEVHITPSSDKNGEGEDQVECAAECFQHMPGGYQTIRFVSLLENEELDKTVLEAIVNITSTKCPRLRSLELSVGDRHASWPSPLIDLPGLWTGQWPELHTLSTYRIRWPAKNLNDAFCWAHLHLKKLSVTGVVGRNGVRYAEDAFPELRSLELEICRDVLPFFAPMSDGTYRCIKSLTVRIIADKYDHWKEADRIDRLCLYGSLGGSLRRLCYKGRSDTGNYDSDEEARCHEAWLRRLAQSFPNITHLQVQPVPDDPLSVDSWVETISRFRSLEVASSHRMNDPWSWQLLPCGFWYWHKQAYQTKRNQWYGRKDYPKQFKQNFQRVKKCDTWSLGHIVTLGQACPKLGRADDWVRKDLELDDWVDMQKGKRFGEDQPYVPPHRYYEDDESMVESEGESDDDNMGRVNSDSESYPDYE